MHYLWPSDLPVAAQQLTLEDSTAAFYAPMAARTYTVGRGADRWKMSVETPPLSSANRTRLQVLLAQTRGRANRLWIPDHSYSRNTSGAFSSSELVSNTSFASTTGWTAVSNATLSVNNGRLRITKTNSSTAIVHCGSMTVVSGAAYVGRVLLMPGNAESPTLTLFLGSTAGASNYGTASPIDTTAPYEMLTACGVTAGTALFMSIELADMTAGEWIEVGYATAARCLRLDNSLVNPQTSISARVKNAPNSTSNLMMAGDLVEIPSSGLHRVTSPLDSNSSGIGGLIVSPPLRGQNADGDPVIVHAPLLRGIIEAGDPSYTTEPGRLSRAQIEIAEAFA